jgi:hypothetical protein
MRRRATIASFVLLCLATPVTARAQGTKPDQKTTTIVGCLVQGHPQGAGGEQRSESGTANANDYFVRTPTVAVPVGATIAVGKPGTTSTSPSSGTPTADSFYRITGLDREQLRPHVGHRVELQGHLTDETSNRTTTRTTVDASGRATTRSETRLDVAGVLHATAIKMMSTACP